MASCITLIEKPIAHPFRHPDQLLALGHEGDSWARLAVGQDELVADLGQNVWVFNLRELLIASRQRFFGRNVKGGCSDVMIIYNTILLFLLTVNLGEFLVAYLVEAVPIE